MVQPKVSILWLNYNSLNFIDIVLESLKAVEELDYDNYELIVIDNGSTDGSSRIIKDFTNRMKIKVKFIGLSRNVGFTGGCNIAFRASDPDSKYIVLLNNDAIPYQDSLRRLVEEMEYDKRLGSAQGVIVDYEHGFIDTAGGLLDEFLLPYTMRGLPPTIVREDRYVTFTSGAYSIHRVKTVMKINNGRLVFPSELFAYSDDILLGLQMWNNGFRVKAFPFKAARHRRSSTFRSYNLLALYLSLRNKIALMKISNSRYKSLFHLYVVRKIMANIARSEGRGYCRRIAYTMIRVLRDSVKLAEKLRRRGLFIDLYRAPIIRLNLNNALKRALLGIVPYKDIVVKTVGLAS